MMKHIYLCRTGTGKEKDDPGPGSSYELRWRHVATVEQCRQLGGKSQKSKTPLLQVIEGCPESCPEPDWRGWSHRALR